RHDVTSVDYLEHRKKRTYKPKASGLIFAHPRGDRGRRLEGRRRHWYHGAALCFNPVGWGTNQDDFARQLQVLQNSQGRNQDLCLLQPPGSRKEWLEGNFPTAFL